MAEERSQEEENLLNRRQPSQEECDELVRAIIRDDTEVVSTLINDGVDMNTVIYEEYQSTPLHISAQCGHSNIINKLLTLGFSQVDCIDEHQWTPLHYAANIGHSKVVSVLITAGANVNARTKRQWTPLHHATDSGHSEVVRILITAGSDIDAKDDELITPMYSAAEEGYSNIINMLIKANAKIDSICKNQSTPLLVAAQEGHSDVVKLLLMHNANIYHTNRDLDTPLHRAAYNGHYNVVKILTKHKADVYSLNKFGESPLHYAIKKERSKVVKFFIEEARMNTRKLDQNIQQQIASLLELETVLELSKTEVQLQLKSTVIESTHEEINESYMDGCLPIIDPRVVLLGCEGSGKTSLIDTFVGNSFQNTPPTEGAEQMKISITTAANWKLMSEKEKIADLKKQALLESEFYVSLKKWCSSLEIPPAAQASSLVAPSTTSTRQRSFSMPTYSYTMSTDEQSSSTVKRGAMAEPPEYLPKIHLSPHYVHVKVHKKYITKEEFQELKRMKEKYNPRKRYVHLWDFAGQQIFHHMHGLFVSEDVVCLIVFNAGKSLFTVPDKRYPDDITPAKPAIKVICYYMEMISARVSKRSTEGDDLSEFLPTFILIGTHIDELHPDIKVATKLAFQSIVPALIKELASKPFAKHIAGSKNNELFTEGSSSIFFVSNKDEMRDPLVIGKIKRVIFKAATITKQSRPIRLLKMERKFMLLAHQDKRSVIDISLAKEVAESCGLSYTSEDFVNVLNYFHQKGILLHFNKVPALSNIIILSPHWLAKLLTYVLTTLKCQPVGPPLALFIQKLQRTGLLEQELLEWSVQQFIKDEKMKGYEMVKLVGSDVSSLLINFKLMANVSNTSLVGQNSRAPGKQLFLVPHLLPKEEFVHSKAFGYRFYYYFPEKFIPDHFVDQLIVKCAEWNRSKQYDLLKLSYQWVCLELGKHQIYELESITDSSVIAIKIIPNLNLSSEIKRQAFMDSNELVRSVQKFINDLMEEHMIATFRKSPVVCYIPCPQCKKMHLTVEKATANRILYCPISRVHADITEYHKILSVYQLSRSEPILPSMSDCEINGQTVSVSQIKEPMMKDLHQLVIPYVAAEWKTVADYLEFKLSMIKIIEEQCRNDPVKCCTELFRQWLSSDYGVRPRTWSMLIKTLKEIKQLSTVTEEIEGKLAIANHPLSAGVVSQSVGSQCSELLKQAPKMKHLNQYVIPKIAADWKKVADSLEFDIHTIRIIERKCQNNPLESCDELMRDWLSSGVGIKPKIWSTLIAALKDLKHLTATVEGIEQDIKCIPL